MARVAPGLTELICMTTAFPDMTLATVQPHVARAIACAREHGICTGGGYCLRRPGDVLIQGATGLPGDPGMAAPASQFTAQGPENGGETPAKTPREE